jgi:hypothetical protein
MRVYYSEKILHGKPYESKVVNNENFNFLMHNNSPNIVPLNQDLKFMRRAKNLFVPTYKNAFIMKEGVWWADFFLPNSIIFYDNENIAGFKGNFYFVSQIEDQLELRKFFSHKPVKYSDVAIMHSRLDEKNLISKLERSFKRLLEVKGMDIK